MGSLLLMFAASPAAHAVKNITVDGHPAPVTLTVGETVTVRFETQKAGDTVQFSVLRDVNRTGKLNTSTDYPFATTFPLTDGGGGDLDPAPKKVAFLLTLRPQFPAGPYLLDVGDASSEIDLPLTAVPKPEAQAVSGRVTPPAGAAPKDALIWADSGLNTPVASANIQPDGTYTLPLPPGTYRLSAEWFGNLSSQPQVVTLAAGQSLKDVNLPLLQGQPVSGTVRDGSGPIGDAMAQLTSARGDTVTTKTFPDGSFAFVVPDGAYQVSAGGGTDAVTVAGEPLDGVDFPPPAPAATSPAAGTLVTAAGNGLPGLGGDGRRALAARAPAPQGIAVVG